MSDVLLISTYHSSLEYSQLRYVKIPSYALFVVIAIFHRYNVRVGCLLTSQMLALCPSCLHFTVEWIRGVNTTLTNSTDNTWLVLTMAPNHTKYELDDH